MVSNIKTWQWRSKNYFGPFLPILHLYNTRKAATILAGVEFLKTVVVYNANAMSPIRATVGRIKASVY